MKKILAGLVCAAVVLSLSGCGSEKPLTSDMPNPQASKASGLSGAGPFAASKPGMWDVIPEIPVTDESAFEYRFDSEMGGMVITDYLKESPKVRVPDTLENEPVVGLELDKCEKQLTQLILPDSVIRMRLSDTTERSLLYLGMPADGSDYNIAAKYAPDYYGKMTADEFYNRAVENAYSDFTAYENLTAIGTSGKSARYAAYDGMLYYDFNGAKIFLVCPQGKSGTITVPSGTTEIGNSAFYRCDKITSISIPDSVTKIGTYAFRDCEKLTRITIPDSVTEIDNNIFDGCTSLSNVTYKGKTYNPDNIGELFDTIMYPNMSGGMLIENNTLVKVSENAVTIEIPATVTEVSDNAFGNHSKLEKITYKNKSYTLYDYDKLCAAIRGEEGMIIKNNVLTKVFDEVTELVIPDKVKEISENAFSGCTALKKVTFGKGITVIEGRNGDSIGKLSKCTSLTEVIIPEGVTKISNCALADCKNLINVTIPNSVTSIVVPVMSQHDSAFRSCQNLKNVTYKGKNYDWDHLDELYDAINYGESGMRIEDGVLLSTSWRRKLSKAVIPNGVHTIKNQAFYSNENLTSVTIPDSVTKIGGGAFYNCKNLKEINIPNGVTELLTFEEQNYDMFFRYGCFEGCTSLKNLTIPDSVTVIEEDVFKGCENIVIKYKGKTYDYAHIDDLYKAINGSAYGLTITSDGVLTAVSPELTEVVIPDRVTSIAGGYNTTSAFANCDKLTKVTFGKGMHEIPGVPFGPTLYSVVGSVLTECTSLNEVIVPNGVTAIRSGAFAYCESLKKITLPDGLKHINGCAFEDCKSLTNLVIPDSVTEIEYREVPISLEEYEVHNAFEGCKNIKVTYKGKTYDYAHIDDLYKAINGD